MKYNGKELKPLTEVVAFEEPKEMLVWSYNYTAPTKALVYAIVALNADNKLQPTNVYTSDGWHDYCAEIPKQNMRNMTREELLFFLWEKNKSECVVARLKGGEYRPYSTRPHTPAGLLDHIFATIDETGKITEFEIPQVEDK